MKADNRYASILNWVFVILFTVVLYEANAVEHWYYPESFNGSLSIRERESFEWEFRLGMSYPGVSIEGLRELEDGNYYWGYSVNGNTVRYSLDIESSVVQNQAVDIDRQTAMIGKRFGKDKGYGILAGITSNQWEGVDDAYMFEIPLPYGHIQRVTDFTRKVNIWSSEFKYVWQRSEPQEIEIQPYIKGNLMKDGDKSIKKLKIGIVVKL